jgi:hypothetical protein
MWEEKSAALLKRRFKDKTFSTAEAYRVLRQHSRVKGGYSLGSIHHLLSALCNRALLIRLGRGIYAFPSTSPTSLRLTDSIKISDRVVITLIPGKLADATRILQTAGVEFMVTGPSALAKFHHYITRRLIHLIYTIKGSGEQTVGMLKGAALGALLNPRLRDIEIALENLPESDIFVVREFANLDGNVQGRALIERALVDSYFESTRRRIPFPEEQVARIFVNAFRNEKISLTKLTRFASRRGIAPEITVVFNALKFRTYNTPTLDIPPHAAAFLSHIKNEAMV